MMKQIAKIITLLFLCESHLAAENIGTAPGTYALSGYTFLGGASQSTSSIKLTNNTPDSLGHAVSEQGFCANEWEVTWESNAGNDGVGTGAGVGMFASNGFHEVAEWLGATTPSAVNAMKSFSAGVGTSLDPGRPSDNHLELVDFVDPARSAFLSNPFFRFKGAGWFSNTFHFRLDGTAIYSVRSAEGRSWSISGRVAHQPALPFHLGFFGRTNSNTNEHHVRNVGFRLINQGNCGIISSDEARVRLGMMCGFEPQCASYLSYLNCASNALVQLRDDEKIISEGTFELLSEEVQARVLYCDGFNECSAAAEIAEQESYASGFTAGVASIDQDAIRQSGYQSGYQSGFEAGNAAGQTSGYSSGYSAGESAGLASGYGEGFVAGRAEGYAAGHDAGYVEGQQAGYANGFDTGYAEGDTAGYNRGFTAGLEQGTAELEAEKLAAFNAGFEAGFQSGISSPAEHDLCALGATEVLSYSVGRGVLWRPVSQNRAQAVRALGKPQDDNSLNFVTLGRGGSIELGFAGKAIVDREGSDFRIVETSHGAWSKNCAVNPEWIEVFGTEDGKNWSSLGSSCRDGEFDLAAGNLKRVIALRLIDKSTRPDLDGFDLDGVGCLARKAKSLSPRK